MKSSLNLSEIEIAWLAGLFEGEASFGIDNRKIQKYKVSTSPAAPFIKIAMVDEDVISKVSKLLNKSYFSPRRLTVTQKKVFICHIGDRLTVQYILINIFPYMSQRRSLQIQRCLDLITQWEEWKKNRNKINQNF
jgi:hypothetical protein